MNILSDSGSGISRGWKHITDWAEGYLWVPIVVVAIWASGKFVSIVTDAPVKENIDWVIDYQAVAYKCVYIIVLTSLMKQATGTWMTKQEKFDHPYQATLGTISVLISFGVFAWLFGR